MQKMFPVVNYSEFYASSLPADPLQFIASYPSDVILLLLGKLNAALFHKNADFETRQVEIGAITLHKLDHAVKYQIGLYLLRLLQVRRRVGIVIFGIRHGIVKI